MTGDLHVFLDCTMGDLVGFLDREGGSLDFFFASRLWLLLSNFFRNCATGDSPPLMLFFLDGTRGDLLSELANDFFDCPIDESLAWRWPMLSLLLFCLLGGSAMILM